MLTDHPFRQLTPTALLVGLTCVGITAAATAQAGIQLFEGSWQVKAFGNEIAGGTGESEFYSAFGIPQGIQCNHYQPRCPFASTPTNGKGEWNPLGGSLPYALFCAPWASWQGNGTTARPAKGGTDLTLVKHKPIPPLYRNPGFFTPGGQPATTACYPTSTGMSTPGGKNPVQAGHPVAGTWVATTTGAAKGGFYFGAAPQNHPKGIRATGVIGEFGATFPYVYSYTYATLRNDLGIFSPGGGPGNFNIKHIYGKNTVASINVKQGAAKFGGTMKMLGALTTKVCYYRSGGCSLGRNNWRYDAIGASVYTTIGGGITQGYLAIYSRIYYNTGFMTETTVRVSGSRFPWTTGSVTVTAIGRGPHKTIHYAHGYDNRTTSTGGGGIGTIQLVTPVLTRWLQSGVLQSAWETGGIGILRIKFVPEPQLRAMLIAGAMLLGVSYRMRRR